jgi:GrpB-like predicted nucleotidyltransferase (UPF0157 family)
MGESVIILPYDPEWPTAFEWERLRLLSALGEAALAIEHVGSTAVPGLAAKPVIDIMVAIADLTRAEDFVPALATVGYERRPLGDFPGRVYFRRFTGGIRTHHLSLSALDTDFWRDHLTFRDHLRAYPEAAREYGELKRALALEYGDDRLGYTEAKTSFVERIVGRGWVR